MSSVATPQPDRDQQLLGLGKQCSHPSCLLVDFLPFKCHHCSESFCQEHFKVEDHKCSKYDEFKHNRVAPNCPLCSTPIAVAPGQDPNTRMDQHLDRECSVVVGKKTTSSSPRCKKPSCNKVLFANIRCDTCRQQFCPAHRFPGDHTCSGGSSANKNTPGSSSPAVSSRPITRPNLPKFASSAKELNSKANAAGSAALGAIKKSASATTAAIASASSSGTTSAGSGSSRPVLPFNKMDRPPLLFPSPNSTDANVHARSVTTSTTTTTTIVTNNFDVDDEPPNVPPPIINSWSCTPPPIFATA